MESFYWAEIYKGHNRFPSFSINAQWRVPQKFYIQVLVAEIVFKYWLEFLSFGISLIVSQVTLFKVFVAEIVYKYWLCFSGLGFLLLFLGRNTLKPTHCQIHCSREIDCLDVKLGLFEPKTLRRLFIVLYNISPVMKLTQTGRSSWFWKGYDMKFEL